VSDVPLNRTRRAYLQLANGERWELAWDHCPRCRARVGVATSPYGDRIAFDALSVSGGGLLTWKVHPPGCMTPAPEIGGAPC
jgi:hypothetical protein